MTWASALARAAAALVVVGGAGVGLGCGGGVVRSARDAPAEGRPSAGDAGRARAEARPDGPRDEVRIAAGRLVRGRDDAPRADERPRHAVDVAAFAIDRTLVTRADFARFQDATGHVTTAERVGFGMVSEEGMPDWTWVRAPGATFRRPFREGFPEAAAFLRDDAPVVLVSADDADAYCAWRGGRLPSEAEWQRAMGGDDLEASPAPRRFPWGDAPEREDGRLGLNFWQGASHARNERRDGFGYVSPVRAFAPNARGIHDPVGNVWQWTSTVYRADAYPRAARGEPEPALAPAARAASRRVLRGGSWWCGACTCEGYGLDYRGKASPSAVFSNNGFRCARALD